MPRRGSPYGQAYLRARRRLLAGGARCALRLVCDGDPATSADHVPPLRLHYHRDGSGCCVLRPACLPCQHYQGDLIRRGRPAPPRPIPTPSRRW